VSRHREQPLIELRGASFGYDGAAVLSHVDYAVTGSEFTGIVGPSGSARPRCSSCCSAP
jgi:ABC-type transporter Mla maintaining outer membrane lipid asymmetry ATPase subunit MlaF